jgi:uncharacterized membrane protein YeaQ/YmgE (transglycosylase-associated protein family)
MSYRVVGAINTCPLRSTRVDLSFPRLAGWGRPGLSAFPDKEDTMIGAIILGIVAGYIGRLLMPGRDKMGFIATMLLGLAGAIVGFLIFTELFGIGDNRMFDLGGLIGAILGVMILLGLYRLVLKDKRHPLAR